MLGLPSAAAGAGSEAGPVVVLAGTERIGAGVVLSLVLAYG
jgi:hypothetical protein